VRVVVFIDNVAEREAIARTLARSTFSVQPVADAKSAAVAIGREATDVILLSWPSLGGADLVRVVRAADASGNAYVVALLDASSGGRDIQPALKAGADDVLIRPFVDAELVARLQAPGKLARWMRSPAKGAASESARAGDLRRLGVWKNLGAVAAEDIAQLVGQAPQITNVWPGGFGRDLACATVSMSFTREQVELVVSVATDAAGLAWLGQRLLGEGADEAALKDALRELTGTVAGAVKRGAAPEEVSFTVGLPSNSTSVRFHGDGVTAYSLSFDSGQATLAVVGEIRKRENRQVRASALCEGMVIVNDVRSESGALLVTAGSRLTKTTAERLARLLGSKVLLEVAWAA
jgi:CheY-like chemotaxis protein